MLNLLLSPLQDHVFCKRQNSRDGENISGVQGLRQRDMRVKQLKHGVFLRVSEEVFFLFLFSGRNYINLLSFFFLNIWCISPLKSPGCGAFFFGNYYFKISLIDIRLSS